MSGGKRKMIPLEHVGNVIGAGPGRGILDVVVPGHMFRDHGDAVGGIFGEEVSGGEA